MKLSKEERDLFVQKHHGSMTNKQLASNTGWSETTIKSVKTRFGLVNTERTKHIKEFILKNLGIEEAVIASTLGCKIDRIRDMKKQLGVYESASDRTIKRLKELTPNFELSDYTEYKNRVTLTCKTCNNTSRVRPVDIYNNDIKCKECLKKEEIQISTIDREVIKGLEVKYRRYNKSVELTKEYASVAIIDKSNFQVECNDCGYTRDIQYGSLLSRKGRCKMCAYKISRKEEDFLEVCKEKGYTLESEYGQSMTVKCNKGHERTAHRHNILTYECFDCRELEATYLYVMDYQDQCKVGISNNPERRQREVERSGNIRLTLRQVWEFPDRSSAVLAEKGILGKFRKLFGDSKIFDGSTEFLAVSGEDVAKYIEGEIVLKAPFSKLKNT